MAYCNYCGHNNPDGASFCSGCGRPINITQPTQPQNQGYRTTRANVFMGEIRHCPACNEVIPPMAAVCPSCGMAFNNIIVSPAITEFTTRLQQFDNQIAAERYNARTNPQSAPATGYQSWSSSGKMAWVIFNICFCGIPVILYLIAKQSEKPQQHLTLSEDQKAQYIKNTVIPNDMENTITMLQIIKANINSSISSGFEENKSFWVNTWYMKAQQIVSSANVAIGNDRTINDLFQEIGNIANPYLSQNPVQSNTNNSSGSSMGKLFLWAIGWLLCFPIPLTVLMAKKTQWNKAIRVLASIIGWLLYLAWLFGR